MNTFFNILTILSYRGLVTLSQELDLHQYNPPGYGTDWIYMIDGKDKPVKGFFRFNGTSRIYPNYDINEAVVFKLFTRERRSGETIRLQERSLLTSSFNPKKKSKFIIHGWFSSGDAQISTAGTTAYLSRYDYNVFIVGWQTIANDVFYPVPLMYTPEVGKHFAKLLTLVFKMGAESKNIHLIGHSLGAHIAGYAAKSITGYRIGRITGLDPALPGFDVNSPESRLSDTDADFVDVIHTCMGTVGIVDPIGHVDIYPNGGATQPGCTNLLLGSSCSHTRSWRYFYESLAIPYIAYSCDSYNEFVNGKCRFSKSNSILMGENTSELARGTYYIQTYPQPPFAMPNLYDNYITS